MVTSILVIDDNEDDQHLFQRALKDSAFSLTMVSSAEAGFACIADIKPDLILLDYNLPDMDGLSFMRKLTENSDAHIPIVMLTGDISTKLAVEAMKSGADDYLVKDTDGRYLKLLPGVAERVIATHTRHEQTRSAEELLHELRVHQIELEMQNDELRRAQVTIEESRDRYADLYEFAPVGYLTLTREGMVAEANLTAAELLGVTRNKLLDRRFARFVTVSDSDFWHRHFLSVLQSDERQVCELTLRRENNILFHAQLDCLHIRDGGTSSVRIALSDITERKKAETILKKHKLIIESASDGYWLTDMMGNLLDANEAYASMSGYSVDELTKMHISQLEANEQPEDVTAHITKIITQGHDRFETRHRHKDGHLLDIEISATFMPEVQQLFVFCHDITESKRAVEILKLNKIIIDTTSEGFWMIDLTGHLLEVNQAYANMMGYTREELVGMHISQISVGNNTSALVMATIQKVVNQGHLSFETQHRRKDGGIVYFDASITFMEKAKSIFCFLRNITERKLAEQELQDQHARVNSLIDAAMDAIVSIDEDQNIIIFNHGAEQMFGYRSADIIGQHIGLLIPSKFRNTHIKHVDTFGKTGITTRTMNQPGQTYGLRANGEEFPFEASISRVRVAGRAIYTAILRDTTLRKQAETELRIAATAFESQEGMLITDANGVILRVNKAFTETTGYTSEEAVGKTPRLLKSGRHDSDFYREMWETINRTGSWQGEVWDRRKNSEVYPKWLTISAVKGENGAVTHYVGSHVDMTERKAAEEEVKNLAFYDPLTRLPNRRLLLDRLDHALASSARSGREGALMFIDLDNFKTLNDTLGHDIGDLLLKHVAQRLESCVRDGDTVARMGGDEFVVMLEDLSKDSLEAAAQTESIGEKILVTLNQPYQLATHECHSTPSIGATLFTNHPLGVDVLFKQADIAMYQSKKAGRNTLRFFDPKMQDIVNVRASLESELRKALDSQQFHLYYQVQMDISLRPFGAEALIRWAHPERGMVSPAQFIPLAEETGLILPIGQWVLETACAQLKAWQQDALTRDLVLAVNVSAKQFRQTDFVAQVQAAVQRHAITPKRLKLELTESLLLDDIEETIATMNTLKEIGVTFSLDDFGTGYSSLQYLKQLSLDQIKIDQSFVRDLALDSSDRAIVRTIIAMAHGLILDVIAEGVETEDQLQFLQQEGCTQYQGYLFGRPVPIEQFEELLKHG